MEEACKTGYAGGEELRRAMAALAGPSGQTNASEVDCCSLNSTNVHRLRRIHRLITKIRHGAPLSPSFNILSVQAEPKSPQPAPLPLQLASVEDVSVRELAFAAQRYNRLAQREPDDFEAVYNHGLALQELALRATASRHEQLQLLQQVHSIPVLCQLEKLYKATRIQAANACTSSLLPGSGEVCVCMEAPAELTCSAVQLGGGAE